jgi:dihydrofolate reductase
MHNRKIILFIATSLDGMIARADGGIDWLFTDQDYGYAAFYESVDTLIMGRKTFEQALSFGEYPYPGKQAYVLSRRRFKTDRPDVEVTADLPGLLRSLRANPGQHIWCVGGAEIAKQLFELGEIDELRLFLHPIILGHGLSLFDGLKRDIKLRLTGTHAFDSGLVEVHYRVEGSREAQ